MNLLNQKILHLLHSDHGKNKHGQCTFTLANATQPYLHCISSLHTQLKFISLPQHKGASQLNVTHLCTTVNDFNQTGPTDNKSYINLH